MYSKILGLGLCFVSCCAWADPQTEMMMDKLDRLEAEMALVQRKVYQQPVTLSDSEKSSQPANIDELYAQIDAQNQVIQNLTSQVEEMSYRLTALSEQLGRMQQDTDFRFNQITSQKTGVKNVDPAPNTSSLSDKETYDKAYDLLKDGQYEKAEQAFLMFMEQYPNSSLSGNANYWLAESYYARQKWAEAAGLFADGFTKYKKSSKAPDCMFKLGLTMKQMGKNKEACTAFKNLNKEFKNLADNLKKRTEQEIKELKCP